MAPLCVAGSVGSPCSTKRALAIAPSGLRNSWPSIAKNSSFERSVCARRFGVFTQTSLDTDKFRGGHAHHLVEAVDDHSAVTRIKALVRLQHFEHNFLQDVEFENQLFQRVCRLIRALVAMPRQQREVPDGGARVGLIVKDLRHHRPTAG